MAQLQRTDSFSYVGVYELPAGGTVKVTRTEPGPVAEATEVSMAPIHAATKTDFFVKVIDMEITSERDSSGRRLRHRSSAAAGTS